MSGLQLQSAAFAACSPYSIHIGHVAPAPGCGEHERVAVATSQHRQCNQQWQSDPITYSREVKIVLVELVSTWRGY